MDFRPAGTARFFRWFWQIPSKPRIKHVTNYSGSSIFEVMLNPQRMTPILTRLSERLHGKGGNMESSKNAGIADWVLSDFSAAEAETLAPVFKTGAELLLRALANSPERLLPEWAKKNCCGEPLA